MPGNSRRASSQHAPGEIRAALAEARPDQLLELFPHCRLQSKGLIATEAFVSLPLVGHEHAALAIRSHFLEFLSIESGQTQLAHQLERGRLYAVVVTTGGGLYRYQLGDLIEVTGYIEGCPLVPFVGRQGYVSDWFGEKLNGAHVCPILQDTFRTLGMIPSFAMLAIDSPEDDELLDRACEVIDVRLCAVFHYDYARQLGQLARVRPFRVHEGASAYLSAAIRNGQKPGDVKLPSLDRRSGWSEIFNEIGRDGTGAYSRTA